MSLELHPVGKLDGTPLVFGGCKICFGHGMIVLISLNIAHCVRQNTSTFESMGATGINTDLLELVGKLCQNTFMYTVMKHTCQRYVLERYNAHLSPGVCRDGWLWHSSTHCTVDGSASAPEVGATECCCCCRCGGCCRRGIREAWNCTKKMFLLGRNIQEKIPGKNTV